MAGSAPRIRERYTSRSTFELPAACASHDTRTARGTCMPDPPSLPPPDDPTVLECETLQNTADDGAAVLRRGLPGLLTGSANLRWHVARTQEPLVVRIDHRPKGRCRRGEMEQLVVARSIVSLPPA